ncbi:MAG: 50S ribosomal protein L29 [Patescibacteria group bacterium]
MATLKMKEILSKGSEEIQKMLNEKREALRLFRFGISGSKARNVKEGKGLKKDIARLLTKINEVSSK